MKTLAIFLVVALMAGCETAAERKARDRADTQAFQDEVLARYDYYIAVGVPKRSAMLDAINDVEAQEAEKAPRRTTVVVREEPAFNGFNYVRQWQRIGPPY